MIPEAWCWPCPSRGVPLHTDTITCGRNVRTIQTAWVLPDDAEVTLEANPGDCSRERLQAIRRSGVNRLSIGVQSLDDNELRLLGRAHPGLRGLDAHGARRSSAPRAAEDA